MRTLWLGCAVAFPMAIGQAVEEYVHILKGTLSESDFSNGNTLPLLGTPWGQAYWAVEGFSDPPFSERWWFDPLFPRIGGIRCTHQPSPWISEWGTFAYRFGFMYEGPEYSQGYDTSESEWRPYLFSTELPGMSNRHGHVSLRFTATSHASHLQMSYPPLEPIELTDYNQTRYIRLQLPNAIWRPSINVEEDGGITRVRGGTNYHVAGVPDPQNFLVYVVAEFDPKPDWWEITGYPESSEFSFWGYWHEALTVDVKTGLSMLDHDQAKYHLDHEVYGHFQQNMERVKQIWNEQLSVVTVTDTGMEGQMEEDMLEHLYTSLYKASLFPRNLAEWKDGRWQHWSPYDSMGRVFDGHSMTDSGFWDAFHTVYTLMELLWPKQIPIVMEGYLTAFQEGGWVPQWASPGYRDSMVGTMSDVSLSDMIVKGFTGFDMKLAMEALYKNAFVAPGPDEQNRGRSGLEDYTEHGFIGQDSVDQRGNVHECISQTLNHAQADCAILSAARFADEYGVFTEEELVTLERRCKNHEQLFNAESGFYQAKYTNGSWVPGWDEFLWGGALTEGGPWQFRFSAPQDVEGLKVMHGGPKSLCDRVVQMNVDVGYVHRDKDHYGRLIHEILEMPINVWGQYSHNNQPTHGANWLPILVAEGEYEMYEHCVKPSHYWVKKTLIETYTKKGYSGDEDNGEMTAWFVLGALGIYDPNPGTKEYVLGSPLFREMRVKLGDKTITIVNRDDSAGTWKCPYCGSKGNSLGKNRVTLQELKAAGTLRHTPDHQIYEPPTVDQISAYSPPVGWSPTYSWPYDETVEDPAGSDAVGPTALAPAFVFAIGTTWMLLHA